MTSLISSGDGPVTRCKLCERDAVGPCARCRAPVCGDCCELTEGGATTFAICLTCVKRGGSSLAPAWLGLLGWLGAIIAVLAAVAVLVSLASCYRPSRPAPAPPPPPVSPLSDRMDTFEINGYVLAGAEYWPYIGKDDIRYPDEVLWGFYPVRGEIPPGETAPNPDTATPQAIECAEQSFAALQVFLAKNPPALRRIVELGESRGFVPRFYLWTNDYSRAADPFPPGMREARLWYWKRKQPEPPKPPGYWKWEARVTQNGACELPRAEQIDAFLAETLHSLEH